MVLAQRAIVIELGFDVFDIGPYCVYISVVVSSE